MDEERTTQRSSRWTYGLAVSVLFSLALAIIGCAPWFEEDVLGSRHIAKFYRDIGIDAPLSWLADTFERLH